MPLEAMGGGIAGLGPLVSEGVEADVEAGEGAPAQPVAPSGVRQHPDAGGVRVTTCMHPVVYDSTLMQECFIDMQWCGVRGGHGRTVWPQPQPPSRCRHPR